MRFLNLVKALFVFFLSLSLLACGNDNINESEENTSDTEVAETDTKEQQVVEESNDAGNVEDSELKFLLGLDGKGVMDEDYKENKQMKKRLQDLLGADYQLFVTNILVSSPYKVGKNVFFHSGIQAHGGGVNEAAIAVDVAQDAIFVIIMDKQKLKSFQEKPNLKLPTPLAEWKAEQIEFDEATE